MFYDEYLETRQKFLETLKPEDVPIFFIDIRSICNYVAEVSIRHDDRNAELFHGHYTVPRRNKNSKRMGYNRSALGLRPGLKSKPFRYNTLIDYFKKFANKKLILITRIPKSQWGKLLRIAHACNFSLDLRGYPYEIDTTSACNIHFEKFNDCSEFIVNEMFKYYSIDGLR